MQKARNLGSVPFRVESMVCIDNPGNLRISICLIKFHGFFAEIYESRSLLEANQRSFAEANPTFKEIKSFVDGKTQ